MSLNRARPLVWFIYSPIHKTLPMRFLLWWVPWLCITSMSYAAGWGFVAGTVYASLTLAACGSFWLLGYINARRRNIHNLAVIIAEYSGEHPDLIEFELKEKLKTRSKKQAA